MTETTPAQLARVSLNQWHHPGLGRWLLQMVSTLILVIAPIGPAQSDVHSYAIVQDDGSLLIRGRVYRLAGIYIPPTERQCRTYERPVVCGPRAVLALDFKIQGFVTCRPQGRNQDGSYDAACYVDRTAFSDGEDLGAYLVRNGWALALPGAPFEYQALEKIARARERGVWGFQVDSVQRRGRFERTLPSSR